MGRPNMMVAATSKNLTKAERQARQEQENRLKGRTDDIRPSSYLTEKQVEIFNRLVEELAASDILSNVDSDSLSNYAFALDQLETLNDMINRNPQNVFDKQMISARRHLAAEVHKYSMEFCLTPQARAKMGSNTLKEQEKEKDPLLKALSGGKA